MEKRRKKALQKTTKRKKAIARRTVFENNLGRTLVLDEAELREFISEEKLKARIKGAIHQ